MTTKLRGDVIKEERMFWEKVFCAALSSEPGTVGMQEVPQARRVADAAVKLWRANFTVQVVPPNQRGRKE